MQILTLPSISLLTNLPPKLKCCVTCEDQCSLVPIGPAGGIKGAVLSPREKVVRMQTSTFHTAQPLAFRDGSNRQLIQKWLPPPREPVDQQPWWGLAVPSHLQFVVPKTHVNTGHNRDVQ